MIDSFKSLMGKICFVLFWSSHFAIYLLFSKVTLGIVNFTLSSDQKVVKYKVLWRNIACLTESKYNRKALIYTANWNELKRVEISEFANTLIKTELKKKKTEVSAVANLFLLFGIMYLLTTLHFDCKRWIWMLSGKVFP